MMYQVKSFLFIFLENLGHHKLFSKLTDLYHKSKDRVLSTVNFFFCIFLQSPHQVDMKNVIECQKHFFAYFNALEARSDLQVPWSSRLFN